VYVKILAAISIFVLSLPSLNKYHEGSFNPKYGYLYIVIFYNISIFVRHTHPSLTYLQSASPWLGCSWRCISWSSSTRRRRTFWSVSPLPVGLGSLGTPNRFLLLQQHEFKPISKFLCIKGILFFSFWQSVALSIFTHFGWIEPIGEVSATEFSNMIQDSLICIEMLPLSIAFAFTFGYATYRDQSPPSSPTLPLDDETKRQLQEEHQRPLHRRLFGNLLHVALPVDVLHETRTAIGKPKKRKVAVGQFFDLSRDQQENLSTSHSYRSLFLSLNASWQLFAEVG